MKKQFLNKFLEHPDREEIISKLIISISPNDIHEWLDAKYSGVKTKGLVLSEKDLKSFKDTYLDIYSTLRDDFAKTKTAIKTGMTESELVLSIENNPTYKELMLKTVGQELDLKQAIHGLILVVETRMAQVFDSLQEDPRNMNTRVDRVLIEYVDKLGGLIEKANKVINNAPDQIIAHQISIQHIDQHIGVFYEAIKRALSRFDFATSMAFMEEFNAELSRLKDPANQTITPIEHRLAEVKILNEKINAVINENS